MKPGLSLKEDLLKESDHLSEGIGVAFGSYLPPTLAGESFGFACGDGTCSVPSGGRILWIRFRRRVPRLLGWRRSRSAAVAHRLFLIHHAPSKKCDRIDIDVSIEPSSPELARVKGGVAHKLG